MDLDYILDLKAGKELDSLIYKKYYDEDLYIREVHTCPDCGWETKDLETSSRCQACWANGDRVTMDELKEVYDFRPSTNISIAWNIAKKEGIAVIPQSRENGGFDWYACDIEAVKYRGNEIAISIFNDSGISCETAEEAICKCVLLADLSQ
ncbi:hypothetical protein BC351_01100 [Paenibacillus ferrarius]|uniref:Phage ABA sandwich domain-containing protein n=1 Tax=Paenibacillus ferrarius TaxID=1469647 RepID=A0A1V4HSV0_9BACL|nr:hypothetical protein [Paenibacillus ferrarius]OPH61868.1 hypothetical protein BC351_01100 [Paenibacillus ferrarius]